MVELARLRGASEELTRVQKRVADALAKGPPWMNGRLVENVRCEPNVETRVTHRLGRKPRGFMIVCARADGFNIGTASADLVATEFNAGQAKLTLVTTGTSPRILSLWFW